MSKVVLDASALLAYLHGEPGIDAVKSALSRGGGFISTVNLAEVLSKLVDAGVEPEAVITSLKETGILGECLLAVPLSDNDAVAIARLRPLTQKFGLSLADRACLALAQRLRLAAMTADNSWLKPKLDIKVTVIR